MNTIDFQIINTEKLWGVQILQHAVDNTAFPENMGAVIWFCDNEFAESGLYSKGFYLSVNDDREDVRIWLGRYFSQSYYRLLGYLSSPETLMNIPF